MSLQTAANALNSPGAVHGTEHRPLSWPANSPITPNFSDWRSGDILVMSKVRGSGPVVAVQTLHADPLVRANAEWTHCAVYIGDGLVVDARWGVRAGIRRVYPDTQVREISVRRFKDMRVTAMEANRMAECAVLQEGTPYTYAPNGYVLLKKGIVPTATGAQKYGLVCSSLIEYSCKLAGINFGKAAGTTPPICPATFMIHPWLDEVPAYWKKTI